MKKLIVIGANHAGTALINTVKASSDEWDVTAYEMNTNCSFLGCGIALWVSGKIEDPSGLFYSSPEALEGLGAKIHMQHRVENIDFDNKKVSVKNLVSGEVFEDTYDKLVISAGTQPFKLAIDGKKLVEYDNVTDVKLYQDAEKLIERLKDPSIKNVTILGGGYIGIELAESCAIHGKNTTLVDMSERLLGKYYDKEFTDQMEKVVTSEGVKLELGQKVEGIQEEDGKINKLITDKGEVETDLVILAVGAQPETGWIDDSKLEKLPNGAIIVNEKQETSIPDVYAIGDASTVIHSITNKPVHIALASNAVRSGKVAGYNIAGSTDIAFNPVQGSNAISVFGLNMVSTGFTSDVAKANGFEPEEAYFDSIQKLPFMKDDHSVGIKVVFDKNTRIILGAQASSTYDISMIIHMYSLAIAKKVTIDELAFMDLFFLPHFNSPFNYVNEVAMVAKEK